MKCKACNGTGYVTACIYESDEIGFVDKNYECAVCHGTGKIKQTNETWFASLTTEEKAMAIVLCCPYEINWFGKNFEKRIKQRMKNLSQSTQVYELGIQKIKAWLQEPHKEE